MRNKILSLLALTGVLFSSCVKENLTTEGGSILAVMENDDTRTSVTDEGVFTWSEGDQVWLHTTSGSVVGTLSDGAGTANANFSFGAYFGEMTGRAVYPYNEGHSISGDVLSVVMPASYDLGSSLSNTNAAMYGEVLDGRLKFNHMAGVMRFKFKNVPAGVNKFTITLDKKINGTFDTDLTEALPVIESEETSVASEKTITLNFDALTETSEIFLYVPLPLGTYNSLDLALYSGSQSVWTYSKSVTNTISRKSLKLMPTITLGGTIGGDIEDGELDENSEPDSQLSDYIDEYGINHGPGVKIGETVWAPVNCGYHATDYKYGKLYQWGRKYGQGYDGDFYDADHNIIGVYCDKYVPNRVAGPVSLLVGQSKGNEDKFYYNSNYPSDWLVVRDDNLWNLGTEDYPVKTEYDPCPEGWRVPTYLELDYLDDNYSSWTTDKNGLFGYWFSGAEFYSELVSQVFLPAAGYCHVDDGIANHRGYAGFYRSSRPYDDGAWSNYFCSSSVWVDFNCWRPYGYSVRCVQDNSPMVLVESVNLCKTSTILSVGESETLTVTILPSNANHQHAHWSSDDPSVVTVDSEGKITAISIGTATITAMAGMQVATCIVTIESVSLEPEIVNLSDEGTANSYIVSKGGVYKFRVVKGNSSENVGEVISAEVLWETLGTDVAPSVGDLIKTASYEDGEITFRTADAFKEGNAVIAAKDAAGNILWSWHIWLTDQPNEQVYFNNAGTMMDRNLGATSATPGDVGALGLLYQWGRKDPFLGSSSIDYNSIDMCRSTIEWPSSVESTSATGTIEYAIANPMTFIRQNEMNMDWYYTGDETTDNSRWGISEKSIYDPCPVGWRVPGNSQEIVWSKALGEFNMYRDFVFDRINRGVDFIEKLGIGHSIWYPVPGAINFADGTLKLSGLNGYYWSAYTNGNYVKYLHININSGFVNISESDFPRSNGISIRCLQE